MLNQKISFYIPSTYNGNNLTSVKEFDDRALEIAKKFGDLFGGFTISENNLGGWISENGDLVIESVKHVVAFTDAVGLKKNRQVVVQLAVDKAREWKQEAVSVEFIEVQGGLSFISG